jgi:NAD dependent epimerase/dehydratase family enzyme
LAAPNPVTNTEMMRTLRGLLERPLGLPAPAWLLEVGAFLLRTETELIIKSRRVIAGRLGAAGFEFRFDRLDDALCNLESRLATRTP